MLCYGSPSRLTGREWSEHSERVQNPQYPGNGECQDPTMELACFALEESKGARYSGVTEGIVEGGEVRRGSRYH